MLYNKYFQDKAIVERYTNDNRKSINKLGSPQQLLGAEVIYDGETKQWQSRNSPYNVCSSTLPPDYLG